MKRAAVVVVALLGAGAVGGSAQGQITVSPPPSSVPPPDDFGIDFVTVGAPGNAAYDGPNGILGVPVKGRGAVPYAYRISRTEVTMGDWFEFLQAYAPFVDPKFANSSAFTTTRTFQTGFDANGVPTYATLDPPVLNNFVANPSWRFAARYVNWLNNGKAITRDAFETGVYDTSTFGEIRDNNGKFLGFTDQVQRSPGARFWIPSLDEWIKAVHYDPNKNGAGQGGWWMYPGGQDEPLTPGLPGEPGAQTSAGTGDRGLSFVELQQLEEVGLYPDTNAPWGLLDASGTLPEFLEGDSVGILFSDGGAAGDPHGFFGTLIEHVNEVSFMDPDLSGMRTFRIATAIPGPGVIFPFGIILAFAQMRQRRKD